MVSCTALTATATRLSRTDCCCVYNTLCWSFETTSRGWSLLRSCVYLFVESLKLRHEADRCCEVACTSLLKLWNYVTRLIAVAENFACTTLFAAAWRCADREDTKPIPTRMLTTRVKLSHVCRVLTILVLGAVVVMLVTPLRNNLVPVWLRPWRQLSNLQVRVVGSSYIWRHVACFCLKKKKKKKKGGGGGKATGTRGWDHIHISTYIGP